MSMTTGTKECMEFLRAKEIQNDNKHWKLAEKLAVLDDMFDTLTRTRIVSCVLCKVKSIHETHSVVHRCCREINMGRRRLHTGGEVDNHPSIQSTKA